MTSTLFSNKHKNHKLTLKAANCGLSTRMNSLKRLNTQSPLALLAAAALSFATSATLLPTTSFALSTDRDQPADIDADDVEIDFKTGKRIFIGNVRVIQGTLRVKADKIIAQYKDGQLKDATAYGSPAKFRQRPDGKEHDVEGEGKTIYIDELNNTITLKKKAALKQGFDTATGNEIFYNMASDRMTIRNADIGTNKKKANKKKFEDDDFFKEKPASSQKTKPQQTKTTADNTTEATAPATKRSDELPEELVLPKKRAQTTTNGRSRLIIVPK